MSDELTSLNPPNLSPRLGRVRLVESETCGLARRAPDPRSRSTGVTGWWRRQKLPGGLAFLLGLFWLSLATSCGIGEWNVEDVELPPALRSLEVLGCSSGIQASFVHDLDPTSVDSESFSVEGVPGTVGYDAAGRTLAFRPGEPFVSGQSYVAVLGTQLRSMDGAPLSEPLRWTFVCIDRTPPAVVDREPGGSDVSVFSSVNLRFSERMDEEPLHSDSVWIEGVESELSYDPYSFTLSLKPRRPLYPGRTYWVHVSGKVRDVAGNVLGNRLSWSFSTREPVDDRPAWLLSPPLPDATACNSELALRLAEGISLAPSSLNLETPPLVVEGTKLRALEWDPQRNALVLEAALMPGQTYRLLSTEHFRDIYGDLPFDPDTELAILEVVDDCELPTLVATSALMGQLGCEEEISLEFSHPVDLDSLDGALFLGDLSAGGHNPAKSPALSFTSEASEDGSHIRLLPASALVHGNAYVLELNDSLRTQQNLPISGLPGSWTFTANCP